MEVSNIMTDSWRLPWIVRGVPRKSDLEAACRCVPAVVASRVKDKLHFRQAWRSFVDTEVAGKCSEVSRFSGAAYVAADGQVRSGRGGDVNALWLFSSSVSSGLDVFDELEKAEVDVSAMYGEMISKLEGVDMAERDVGRLRFYVKYLRITERYAEWEDCMQLSDFESALRSQLQ